MRLAKKVGVTAAAGLLTLALIAPTSAEARGGRIAAGIVGGLAAGALIGAAVGGGYWGPYPYYYGYPAPVYYYPPAPYWRPGPFWGPYAFYGDCYRRAVWRGRHWHYVRVCY